MRMLIVLLIFTTAWCQPRVADTSIFHAAKWLMSTFEQKEGWEDNARAILALGVGEHSWMDPPSDRMLAGIKGYEMELALTLCNESTRDAMTPGRVALNSLALQSACFDPTNFHGTDLIQLLLTDKNPRYVFEFGLVTLAICAAGHTPPELYVDRLVQDAQEEQYGPSFMGDTLSVVIVALRCVQDQSPTQEVADAITNGSSTLLKSSKSDGSFGNIWTTDWVVQALMLSGHEVEAKRSLPFLLSHQNQDGSFSDVQGQEGDLFTTTETIMGLDAIRGGLGYLSPRDIHCNQRDRRSSANQGQPRVKLFYETRVGTVNYESKDTMLRLPNGTTAFDVMLAASKQNCPDFCFEYKTYPGMGHYITSIGGVAENQTANTYWFVYYTLPGQTEPIISPVGVDLLQLYKRYTLVMWYRTWDGQ